MARPLGHFQGLAEGAQPTPARVAGLVLTGRYRGGGRDILGDKDILPLAKHGMSALLAERLLGFVTAGQLEAGDKLPTERDLAERDLAERDLAERDLAERFAVSRPTVREALRALSVLGVIEIRHGGGAFASALTATDLLGPLNFFLSLSDVSVEKLYHARCLIEGEICALAAALVTEQDLRDLTALIDQQENARRDATLYLALDSQFHERLARIADNPFLARAQASLNVLGIEFRKLVASTTAAPTRSISDHRAILAAIAAADHRAARAAMVAHMNQVLATTRAELDLSNA